MLQQLLLNLKSHALLHSDNMCSALVWCGDAQPSELYIACLKCPPCRGAARPPALAKTTARALPSSVSQPGFTVWMGAGQGRGPAWLSLSQKNEADRISCACCLFSTSRTQARLLIDESRDSSSVTRAAGAPRSVAGASYEKRCLTERM